MEHSEVEDLVTGLGSVVDAEGMADVKIYVGKERKMFFANSFILASRTHFFRAMFFEIGMKEQRTKEWIVEEAQPEHFKDFLQFLYTGKVVITPKNVFSLLELSDKYLFTKLNCACQRFLTEDVKIENALLMLDEALNRNAKELEANCLEVIDKEALKCLEAASSVEISVKCMKELLIRDTLNAKEIDLFKFLIKWGKKESPVNWKEKVKPFLQYIRFPLMNLKELIREVRPLGVVDDEQYIEALEFNGDRDFYQQTNQSKTVIPRKAPQTPLSTKFFDSKHLSSHVDISKYAYFLGGPNYTLSNNNKLVTKTGSTNQWNTTCITDGVMGGIWKWSLKIINIIGGIMVGIAPNNINQSTINHTQCGWYFYAYNSTLYSGPPFNYRAQTYSNVGIIGKGSIVDVELNILNKTIKFFVNGQDCGIAYNGILVDQPLKLAVLLRDQNDSVELLSVSRL